MNSVPESCQVLPTSCGSCGAIPRPPISSRAPRRRRAYAARSAPRTGRRSARRRGRDRRPRRGRRRWRGRSSSCPRRAPGVAAAGHLAAGAEDQADLVRVLPGGELARDLRIRDHAVEQALRAVWARRRWCRCRTHRPGGGSGRPACRPAGESSRSAADRATACRSPAAPKRRRPRGRSLEGKVEPEVRHQVAADELVAGAVRRRGEGLEREPRRLDAAERQHDDAVAFHRQDLAGRRRRTARPP